MKRYYFNIRNAEGMVIQKMNTIANSLETAKGKISHRLLLSHNNLATFLQITFDYHEKIN